MNAKIAGLRTDLDKRRHLQMIQEKSTKQQYLFQNPLFSSKLADNENEDEFLLSKINRLEESEVPVNKEINLQSQHRVKSHIINHKLKNNYDYVREKYFVRIWREQALKLRLEEDYIKSKQKKGDQDERNLIEDMIKNQRYEKLKQQQEDEDMDEKGENEAQLEIQAKLQKKGGEAGAAQGSGEQHELFKMPEADLLKYIPYCTDIYLGKD